MSLQIGQKVVCINNTPLQNKTIKLPLIKGKEYVINEITTLSCRCKHIVVDVGLICNIDYPNGVVCEVCHQCSTKDYYKGSIWWFAIERFAPLIDNEAEEGVENLLNALGIIVDESTEEKEKHELHI